MTKFFLLLSFLLVCYCLTPLALQAAGKSMIVNQTGGLEVTQVRPQTLTPQNIKLHKRMERRVHAIQRMLEGGENKVIGAALLAVFLGCLGIHRVYLGGSWLLILGYIITFGGIFGLLPLIDFIRIVAGGIDHYMGNNALFAAFQGMNY